VEEPTDGATELEPKPKPSSSLDWVLELVLGVELEVEALAA
jgi:hypothetical protein